MNLVIGFDKKLMTGTNNMISRDLNDGSIMLTINP